MTNEGFLPILSAEILPLAEFFALYTQKDSNVLLSSLNKYLINGCQ